MNRIRQKTLLLQQSTILLLDSKQDTRCVLQFGTINFIKTYKHLRRSANFSRFIKNTLLHIFFLYFYSGFIFREAYIRNHFCVSILMGLYTRALYSEGSELIFGVLWYLKTIKTKIFHSSSPIFFLSISTFEVRICLCHDGDII